MLKVAKQNFLLTRKGHQLHFHNHKFIVFIGTHARIRPLAKGDGCFFYGLLHG